MATFVNCLSLNRNRAAASSQLVLQPKHSGKFQRPQTMSTCASSSHKASLFTVIIDRLVVSELSAVLELKLHSCTTNITNICDKYVE